MIILYVMELNTNSEVKAANPFPFNNLFLIKGYVTGKNDFWFYLFGIVAAFLGYAGFQTVVAVPLINKAVERGITLKEIIKNPNILFNPDAIGINRSFMLAILGGMFVFTLLFFWFAVRYVQNKTLTSIITGFEKIRWKRYFFSFAVWGILLLGLTIVSYFINPEELELRFDPFNFIVLLIVTIIFIPLQTATEEIIFRGYLIQGISQFKLTLPFFLKKILNTKNPGLLLKINLSLSDFSVRLFRNGIIPIIITSVLFGIMHASNPEAKAHGLLIMMPYYILFGAFLGVLTLLDEGAELGMGIHCANNLFSSLLICSKNSVLQTDAIFYTTVENPGAEFITWLAMALICFFILFKKYKLNNWKLLIR